MKRTLKQFSLLVLLAAAFSACQPKKDSVRSNVTGTTALGTAGLTGLGSVSTSCTQGQSTMGAIYETSPSGAFTQRVKALLSATMAPENIGNVGASLTDTTGVRFTGAMQLDASGNVVSASSNLTITVYDEIWFYNQSYESPILLEFSPSQGATFSGNFNLTSGQGYLLVKDSYGEIRFDGTITSSSFSGNVTFRNYTTVVSGQNASSGTLGQFMINSCGIVRK